MKYPSLPSVMYLAIFLISGVPVSYLRISISVYAENINPKNAKYKAINVNKRA